MKCCICNKIFEGEEYQAYDAEPIKEGICCINCYSGVVFPIQLAKNAAGQIKTFFGEIH